MESDASDAFQRPQRAAGRRLSRPILGAILLLGLILALGVGLVMWHTAHVSFRDKVADHCLERARSLSHGLRTTIMQLQRVVSLFASEAVVTDAQFQRFAAVSLANNEVIFRVMYADRVTHKERHEYERISNRTIFHFDNYDSRATFRQMENHTRHLAEDAAEYFPISHLYPSMPKARGFDLMRDDITRSQLGEAVHSCREVAISTSIGTDPHQYFTFIAPQYARPSPDLFNYGFRRCTPDISKLYGVLVAYGNVTSMVAAAMRPFRSLPMTIELWDESPLRSDRPNAGVSALVSEMAANLHVFDSVVDPRANDPSRKDRASDSRLIQRVGAGSPMIAYTSACAIPSKFEGIRWKMVCSPTTFFDGYTLSVAIYPWTSLLVLGLLFGAAAYALRKHDIYTQAVEKREKLMNRAIECLRKAQSKAHEANQSKSTFLSFLCHELRNPLHGIIGMTSMTLESAHISAAERRDNVDSILSSAHLMKVIVDDVLDIQKLESGKVEFECFPYDIVSLIQTTVRVHKPNARKKGVILLTHFSDTADPLLFGDPYRLRQIVCNLLTNAVKFTAHGSIGVFVRILSDVGLLRRSSDEVVERAESPLFRFQPVTSMVNVDCTTGENSSALAIPLGPESTPIGVAHDRSENSKVVELIPSPPEQLRRSNPCAEGRMLGLAVQDNPKETVVVEISVEDTGIGIPEVVLPTLFQSWSQGKLSVAREYGGTGLGLSIIKQIVDLMGGVIRVASRVGVGTRFTVLVPMLRMRKTVDSQSQMGAETKSGDASASAAAAEPAPSPPLLVPVSGRLLRSTSATFAKSRAADEVPQPSVAATTGDQPEPAMDHGAVPSAIASAAATALPRVLLAEDQPINQKIVQKMLQNVCFIDVANNGLEAVKKMELATYDAILMDINMPVMSGHEATMQLRSRGFTLPIIALTANALKEDQDKCRSIGMDDVIVKPFRPGQLIAVLSRYIQLPLTVSSAVPDSLAVSAPQRTVLSTPPVEYSPLPRPPPPPPQAELARFTPASHDPTSIAQPHPHD